MKSSYSHARTPSPTSRIVTRWATARDRPVLVEFRGRQIREANPRATERELQRVLRVYESWLKKRMARGEVRVLVITDGCGQALAVGALLLRRAHPILEDLRERSGYVFSMYTVPNHRRRGLGRLVLQHLSAQARASGIQRITLHPTINAHEFYTSCGFEPTGELGRMLRLRRDSSRNSSA